MKKLLLLISFCITFFVSYLFAGTTGKIAGRVIDAETGEPLPGANVIMDAIWFDDIEVDMGTKVGAASDPDGYYFMINISPGEYSLKVTMMGYAVTTVNKVKVEIDRTTNLNFSLKIQAIEGDAIVITADKEVLKKDLASSQSNISASQIKDLPVANITEVVALNAGSEGMSIRGGGTDEVQFMMDGVALRDERTNRPVTGLALSSVQEILIQSGGFNAEYGDLQAGVINVVTKEGDVNKYSGTITFKYSPPAAKHFGISVYDPNSYFLRPYLDTAVCWTGTANGAWDEYQREQYPEFDGWNTISENTLKNEDPYDDVTPAGARQLFIWQHRRTGYIEKPDYNMDAGFGGPVPFLSKQLGNLRFFTSFRNEKNMYLVPFTREGYYDYSWSLKMTSDVSSSIKLTGSAFIKKINATCASQVGGPDYYYSPDGVAEDFQQYSQAEDMIWMKDYWNNSDITNRSFSLKMTHILSPKTFYEGTLEYSDTKYDTYRARLRDTTRYYDIGLNYNVDEAPYGHDYRLVYSNNSMLMGVKANARDSTKTSKVRARFDVTSQINRFNQVKTGLELVAYNYKMNYGGENPTLPSVITWNKWERSPLQAAIYIQDKLEFEGWIATLGLRGEYLSPGGQFIDIDSLGVYNKKYFSTDYNTTLNFPEADVNSRFTLLPRLGISHPITINSKMYFNYGHMRQRFSPDQLYGTRRYLSNQMNYFGDPELPLEKTVAYELGYDHALFDAYLVHIAAYYKDKTEQSSTIRYTSADNKVDYYRYKSNYYQDIRGFELELRKNAGKWFTGFFNYAYMVSTYGYFGYRRYYENPSTQSDYIHNTENFYQTKPLARPRINLNLAFHTPRDFGPKTMGQNFFGGWDLTLTSTWKGGEYLTWNPGSQPGIENNVQWVDYVNSDLLVNKTLSVNTIHLAFVLEVQNLFNLKYMTRYGFVEGPDYTNYMMSLHLPESVGNKLGYGNIPGDDRPGTYRKSDVEYVKMIGVTDVTGITNPKSNAIYYESNTQRYLEFSSEAGEWAEVAQSRINQIKEDKAYIDNPNNTSFMFLNPRDIYIGLRLSFDF